MWRARRARAAGEACTSGRLVRRWDLKVRKCLWRLERVRETVRIRERGTERVGESIREGKWRGREVGF